MKRLIKKAENNIKWEDIPKNKQKSLIEDVTEKIITDDSEQFQDYCDNRVIDTFNSGYLHYMYDYQSGLFGLYGTIEIEDVLNLKGISIDMSELEISLLKTCIDSQSIYINNNDIDLAFDCDKVDISDAYDEDYVNAMYEQYFTIDEDIDIKDFCNKMRTFEQELNNILDDFCDEMTNTMEDWITIPDEEECVNYILNKDTYIDIDGDTLLIIE